MDEIIKKDILNILKENPNGYLATIDYDKPRVRPFGFIMEEGGRLYFCTNSTKNVYKQLLETPFVEYVCTSKEMMTVRVSGKIEFCEDIYIKEKVLNVFEAIKSGYKTAENPIFKVFYLEHGTITTADILNQKTRAFSF